MGIRFATHVEPNGRKEVALIDKGSLRRGVQFVVLSYLLFFF